MSKRLFQGILVLMASGLLVAGCSKPQIEDKEVSEIEVSEPPEYNPPEPPKPAYAKDGIRMVEDSVTYFGAVVPVGAIEISKDDNEIRFYVKGMNSRAAQEFIKKYFPYQEMKYFPAVDLIELYDLPNPELENGNVDIAWDENVRRPVPGEEVEITVFNNKKNNWYEWVYKNPAKRQKAFVEPPPLREDDLKPQVNPGWGGDKRPGVDRMPEPERRPVVDTEPARRDNPNPQGGGSGNGGKLMLDESGLPVFGD